MGRSTTNGGVGNLVGGAFQDVLIFLNDLRLWKRQVGLGIGEIDTIIGKEHKGAIVSMLERHSKLTLLAQVPRKTAQEVEEALTSRLTDMKDCVLILIADNGKEFANHQTIASKLGVTVYFTRPYHSWERGLNEHTNGLIRQYLPNCQRLDAVGDGTVREIENLLNNRPRKVLQFRRSIFEMEKALLTK